MNNIESLINENKDYIMKSVNTNIEMFITDVKDSLLKYYLSNLENEAMIADLRTLPFSRKGSWMVLSELNENWNGCGNEAGLYLRTVHSSAVKFF